MSGKRNLYAIFAALTLVVAAAFGAQAVPVADQKSDKTSIIAPLNLAVLIQDDLIPRVGNELGETRSFIRGLPAGSRVMVAYVTAGTLQVRQPFTDDLEKAARSLRIPASSEAASPYNPFVEVIEALRKFDGGDTKNRNAMLLISDGLDVSRGFDVSSTTRSIDLDRAIREANKRQVTIYSFFAPSVGLMSSNRLAVSYGQSALNQLSNQTGGRAFFQGTSFVTFSGHFERLREALNEELAKAY
jgi:hypothetical protein